MLSYNNNTKQGTQYPLVPNSKGSLSTSLGLTRSHGSFAFFYPLTFYLFYVKCSGVPSKGLNQGTQAFFCQSFNLVNWPVAPSNCWSAISVLIFSSPLCVCVSHISLDWPHGLQAAKLLCPWNFSDKSEQPLPSPWDLPDPGIEPGYPTLQGDFLPSEPPRKLFQAFMLLYFSL